MTQLKLFILQSVLCVISKNRALGNLGSVRLAVLTLTAELKFLGLNKNFRDTFMPLLKPFYFTNFSLCQLEKWSTGKLRLAVLTPTAGSKIFGPQKNFKVYIYDPSKFFFVL